MDEERTYRLRWMNTNPELLADLIALEALDRDKALAIKRRAVTYLGIEIREGETPYDAWLRHLCAPSIQDWRRPSSRIPRWRVSISPSREDFRTSGCMVADAMRFSAGKRRFACGTICLRKSNSPRERR